MNAYLCYDVRGIQSFIFSIPKLKYIVGGSAVIDQFDKKEIPVIGECVEGITHIYSAGGKGAFIGETSALTELKKLIVAKAGEFGLSIRIGIDKDFYEAVSNAQENYSFVPEITDAQPCRISGLYPADNSSSTNSTVEKRVDLVNNLDRRLKIELNDFFKKHSIDAEDVEFFRNIDAAGDGYDGAAAIGGRNRWAVICMDGNDMGSQFRAFASGSPGEEETLRWLKEMSFALDHCTLHAAVSGIECVLEKWMQSSEGKSAVKQKKIILPIRPLLVGGDDIVLLCHVSYAFNFVISAMEEFNQYSKQDSQKKFWAGTGGELTISAGMLFCPVGLPLHTAIPYAETLLSSAKTLGRSLKSNAGAATPPCLDWEQVTDGLIDTPAGKRQREFTFYDGDRGVDIFLTDKPYSIDAFKELMIQAREYENIPATVRHKVLPGLFQPFDERLAFYAMLGKNHSGIVEKLKDDLCDYHNEHKKPKQAVSTNVVDALLVLEEEIRMQKTTI